MQPMVKWAGGKSGELAKIKAFLPQKINRYIEPFVGGGAVFFGLEPECALLNDLSQDLMDLYELVRDGDPVFFQTLQGLFGSFEGISALADREKETLLSLYGRQSSVPGTGRKTPESRVAFFLRSHKKELQNIGRPDPALFLSELSGNLLSKIRRLKGLEEKKPLCDTDILRALEAAMKSAFYMTVRTLWNRGGQKRNIRGAFFYFLREYCYSSMFRYNAKGEFNVPYGGISYNRKQVGPKLESLQDPERTALLQKAELFCGDFEDFLRRVKPERGDFLFLDPPYDSEFSTYCQNPFDREAQTRLRDLLTDTKADFMLVIKDTDFIRSLYEKEFHIREYDKKYLVSFKNRNDRAVRHLMITNY